MQMKNSDFLDNILRMRKAKINIQNQRMKNIFSKRNIDNSKILMDKEKTRV